jgi:Leucine-rich repeat (LRR) protein
MPACVLASTQLTFLNVNSNRLSSLSSAIGRLTALTELYVSDNHLVRLPREVALAIAELVRTAQQCPRIRPVGAGQLASASTSQRTSVSICRDALLTDTDLQFDSNRLCWLPIELDRLPTTTEVFVGDNPLPLSFVDDENARARLVELFCVTTHIGMIRERASEVCFALQDLELPAPLTLEIIDELCPNNIRMWAKWELITMVKHFHQRTALLDD